MVAIIHNGNLVVGFWVGEWWWRIGDRDRDIPRPTTYGQQMSLLDSYIRSSRVHCSRLSCWFRWLGPSKQPREMYEWSCDADIFEHVSISRVIGTYWNLEPFWIIVAYSSYFFIRWADHISNDRCVVSTTRHHSSGKPSKKYLAEKKKKQASIISDHHYESLVITYLQIACNQPEKIAIVVDCIHCMVSLG